MSASSSLPNGELTFSLRTVMALSTITCDGLRRPFSGEGAIGTRIRGASTRVPEISSTVVVAASLN
jgi:hypothetical protein